MGRLDYWYQYCGCCGCSYWLCRCRRTCPTCGGTGVAPSWPYGKGPIPLPPAVPPSPLPYPYRGNAQEDAQRARGL